MKHNYLFFSISDENKEARESLEGEGELKSDSKKKEKKSFEKEWRDCELILLLRSLLKSDIISEASIPSR